MSAPRYSDQETALILKRAAELQEGLDGRDARMSLEDIQSAAAEAGIEPAFVAEAAGEMERPRPTVGWLGAPTRFHDDRLVPGAISMSAVSELVDLIRADLGVHGDVQQVLDTVEWRGRTTLGATIVTVAPRAGGTRVAVTTSRADHAFVVALGSAGVGILSAAAGLALALAATESTLAASAIVAAAGFTGTVASARIFWGMAARHWRHRTRALVETLVARAAALATPLAPDRAPPDAAQAALPLPPPREAAIGER